MANLEITALTAFDPDELDLDADVGVFVDTSDTTMAASGTNKGVTARQIVASVGIVNSGFNSISVGNSCTQSGYYNLQSGFTNTQAGYGNIQGGSFNSQSGSYGIQCGLNLDDGGLNQTFMFGDGKTATIGSAAYFWVDNGVRTKPLGSTPSNLEDGTFWITTAGDFVFRANGTTKTVAAV